MTAFENNPSPYLTLVEGASPGTPASGRRRLFVDSADGLLKYIDDAGTVTPIGAGGNDVTLVEETTPSSPATGSQKLFIDSADHTLKRVDSGGAVTDIEGGGGGGGGWDVNVNLPLSTLTGWTAGAGTWTVASSVIKQTATTATAQRLHYNTLVPLNNVVAEWEQRIDAAAAGQAGIVFGTPKSSDGDWGFLAGFTITSTQTTAAYTEVDNQVAGSSIALGSAIAHTNWYKVKVHKSGSWCTYWLDTGSGYVLVGSMELDGPNRAFGRIAFKTYNAQASFRNLKVWSLTLPT